MMTLCSGDHPDVSHLCYDFWETQGYISGGILCTNHRCYKKRHATHSLTWNQAQDRCRLRGGNLMTINSFEELQLLRMVLLQDVSLLGMMIISIGLQLQQTPYELQHKRSQQHQRVSDHK